MQKNRKEFVLGVSAQHTKSTPHSTPWWPTAGCFSLGFFGGNEDGEGGCDCRAALAFTSCWMAFLQGATRRGGQEAWPSPANPARQARPARPAWEGLASVARPPPRRDAADAKGVRPLASEAHRSRAH